MDFRLILLGLAVLVVLAAAAILMVRGGISAKTLVREIDAGRTWLQHRGPVAYYAGVVVAACLGAPVSPFSVAGAAAFGTAVAFPGILAAIGATIIISHFIAIGPVQRVLKRILIGIGYSAPQVPREKQVAFILFFRITPGIPFAVQNYLLPLGGVPLKRNLVVSLIPQVAYHFGFVFLGASIYSGSIGRLFLGFVLLGSVFLLVQIIRRRNGTKAAKSTACG